MTPLPSGRGLTSRQATERIRQKRDYLLKKIESDPDSNSSHYAHMDIAAFDIAIASIEYADAMSEYEAMQGSQ